MTETFLVGDPHFTHRNIIKFTDSDGNRIRPFESLEEHDETLVENWNKTVKTNDKIYVMGDIVINRKALPIFSRLNGDKVLIKGNHDILKLHEYTEYFRDIRAYHVMNGEMIILSHIPVHTSQLQRFRCNVHAHTHQNVVKNEMGDPDLRYLCVSMEQINFTPISMNVIKEILTQRGLYE